MPAPSLPRRYVVAGIATAALVGGGAVVANAATADRPTAGVALAAATSGSSATGSSAAGSSAPSRPSPPTPRPHLDGTVTAVSGDDITIKDHDGFTREIVVTSATKYTLDGKTSALSAVTKGRFVHGDGTVDSNGTSLDATSVAIFTSAPKPGRGPGGPGPGRPGLGGPGAHGPAGRGAGAPAGLPKPTGTAPSGAPSTPKASASAS